MKNQFRADGKNVVIYVPNKKGTKVFEFTVMAEDLPMFETKAFWRMDKNNYSAIANYRDGKNMKKITMQKLLTGWRHTDYVDGNRFNLVRGNLVKGKAQCHHAIGTMLKGNKYYIVPGESVTLWTVQDGEKCWAIFN